MYEQRSPPVVDIRSLSRDLTLNKHHDGCLVRIWTYLRLYTVPSSSCINLNLLKSVPFHLVSTRTYFKAVPFHPVAPWTKYLNCTIPSCSTPWTYFKTVPFHPVAPPFSVGFMCVFVPVALRMLSFDVSWHFPSFIPLILLFLVDVIVVYAHYT